MNTNKIFYSLLLVLSAMVIVTAARADVENRRLAAEYSHYKEAKAYISEAKYAEAQTILIELLGHNPDSYDLRWYYGICLEGEGKFDKAVVQFKKARDLRPVIVRRSNFLFHYGKALMGAGDYNMAKECFLGIKQLNTDPELIAEADKMLAEIEVLKGKTANEQ